MDRVRGRRGRRLDGLYCFYLVCKYGSLREVAMLLGMSVPAMSEKMTKLQRETGPLLYRPQKTLVPTPEGRAVYERIKPHFEALENYWAG